MKKHLINDPAKFLATLKDYDKDHIPDKTVKKVNAILNSDTFTLEKAANASNCLVGIYKWADAMMKYHEVIKIINQKRLTIA